MARAGTVANRNGRDTDGCGSRPPGSPARQSGLDDPLPRVIRRATLGERGMGDTMRLQGAGNRRATMLLIVLAVVVVAALVYFLVLARPAV